MKESMAALAASEKRKGRDYDLVAGACRHFDLRTSKGVQDLDSSRSRRLECLFFAGAGTSALPPNSSFDHSRL